MEQEFSRLYQDIGLGLTTWSPLASGILSGKYVDGIPENSRAALQGYDFIREAADDEDIKAKLRRFIDVARRMEVTPAQLALAWVASNPHVSTVILGASTVQQLEENLGAVAVMDRLGAEIKTEIAEIFTA